MDLQPNADVNRLAQRFPRAYVLPSPLWGSYLVAKSSQSGIVLDVEETDLSLVPDVLIEWVVIPIRVHNVKVRSQRQVHAGLGTHRSMMQW
jgi:hypothetical protein